MLVFCEFNSHCRLEYSILLKIRVLLNKNSKNKKVFISTSLYTTKKMKIAIKHLYTGKVIESDNKNKKISTNFVSEVLNSQNTDKFIYLENGPQMKIQNLEFIKKRVWKKNKSNDEVNFFAAENNTNTDQFSGDKNNEKNSINKKINFLKNKKIFYFTKTYKNVFKNYLNQERILRQNTKAQLVERQSQTVKLLYILSNIFGKGINIEIVRLSSESISAHILAKAISFLCLGKSFNRIKIAIKRGVQIKTFDNRPNNIVGLKVTVHGRLNQGRITPRKTKASYIIGRFKNCTTDVARVTTKNFKGQYSITVKLAII